MQFIETFKVDQYIDTEKLFMPLPMTGSESIMF